MREVSPPSELMKLKHDVYGQVVLQLEKDFTLSGISIDLSAARAPEVMWQMLLSTLDDLLKNDPESLRNLLYRVDLNEAMVNAMVLEKKETDFLQELALQLIAREIKKILNRLKQRLD